ncbi:MAG: osmotically inducible protein OsmC [Verrucomicrobiales bacterium]|nr:osmotically inducible protein OsmC [Verrucomicrobiales bacterium]|tara:strand:- start:11135 stop:11581 length:447 start_codon:yes stop_codon:yes gene_type:complete
MSEHKTTLIWNRGDNAFSYKEYPRTHQWTFPRSGQSLKAAAAPEFLGGPDCVDPEETFTAALTSCHMLTFLAIACMSGYVIESYEDNAVGHLEKADDGKPWLARVTMNPRIVFSGEKHPSPEDINNLHHKAHAECFLARSVKTKVTWS